MLIVYFYILYWSGGQKTSAGKACQWKNQQTGFFTIFCKEGEYKESKEGDLYIKRE